MKKHKISIWLGLVMARYSYLIGSVSDWKSLMNLKRTITLSLLAFFAFNLGAPSALAYYELKKAYAADFGGVVSGAVSSIFGKDGDVLQQFDQKGKANEYKNLAASQTTFDLGAILVDEDIANNTQEYDGLRSLHNPTVPADPAQAYRKLEAKTLIDRVERYAEDVQGVNKVKNPEPFVKTVVIKVKKTDSTIDVSSALEKLYREGDGTIGERNRLKGIVLVGDVPLPVVNKNGNRFVSMFPYTDFDDPYYIVDNETQDFVVNVANKNAAVEVWHGVIKAPVQGPEGNNLLAEYLDKNHLYKLGEPAYADFAKKIFYSDLVKEFQSIGAEGLPGYNSYLKYWEDISYVRFNKTWAQKLFSESSFGKPEGDGFDNDNDGKIDEDPSNGYDDDGDAEKGSPLFGLINRVDDDGDGKIDNDQEGVWGYCSAIPATGKKALENCQEIGKPYKTGDFYNVKAGSFYFVSDGVNNNSEENTLIDEGIDEDEGDAFIKIDNDRDGRVDEDTSRDNDADGDKKSDEDGPGDMNSDGCPGQCKVDEDQDSVDSDSDFYPDGYEKDYGKLGLTIGGLADLIDAASSGNIKASFDSLKQTTDREDFFDFPAISLSPPIGIAFSFPRIIPFPSADEWIDEGSPSDDDEDGKIDEDGTVDNDNDQDGTADEDPGDALGNDGKGSGDFMDQLPDIRTKDVIMNFMKNYDQLVEKFYADINVWTDFTGRYSHTYDGTDGKKKTDLTAIPALISAKDEFTRIYLKQINDALEKRVDQYVQKLQYDINLAKGATLSGYVVLPDANGVFPPNQKIKFNDVQFINFGYRNDAFFAGIEGLMDVLKTLGPAAIEPAKQSFLDSLAGPVTAATPIYINGKSIDSIDNIQQCSLYRGSEGLENSQMVIANTVYDQLSNQNTDPVPQMPKEWNSQSKDALIGVDGNDYHGLYWWWNNSADSPMVQWLAKQRTINKAFAGCFSENSKFPDRCFPSLATRYIFSLGGTRKVTGVPSAAVSHQACFDMKEKSGYDAFALAANLYLKAIGEKQVQSEKKAQDTLKPNAAAAYKKPADIKLIDFANKAPEEYELLPGTYLPIPPALILAAQASPSLGSFTVNFGDVLKKYLGADRVDNNGNGVIDEAAEAGTEFFAINPSDGQPNWYQVGEQLLQSKREDEAAALGKDKPLKFGNEVIPGTKEVYVRVTPIPGKSISSLIYHKEPTADTLQAQTYELERDANGAFIEDPGLTEKQKKTDGKYKVVTKTAPDGTAVKKETRYASNIPIDSPRYVSFRDSKGAYQKIIYPNAFTAGSTEQFKQQLKDLEAQLKAIDVNPLYAGIGPASIDNYLTEVVDGSLNNDVINTSEDMISVVSEKKMSDALKWKSMDLDQKHQYAFSHYLGSGFNPFTSLTESAKGYEMLYLVANGQADGLSMTFNKDIPPAKTEPKKDTVDCNKTENAKKAACKDIVPESDGPMPEVPIGKEADMESVIIFEWFVRLGEWAKETTDIINGKGAVTSCPAGSFADYVDSTNADALAYQPTIPVPVDLNGDGIADAANETVKLNLKLVNQEKNVLKAGSNDQTKLAVEALTSGNKLNAADSFNEVRLVVKGNENGLVTIVGNDTAALAGGKAEFTLQAGQNGGTVTVDAVLVKDSKVKSNSLAVVVSKKQIKLISYRRYKTYKFLEGPAAGYQIYDGNGNLIADVNPKTGYIKLLSNDYLLRVLPAVGSKPVRLAVANKYTDQVVALLYFILSGEQKINIDAPAEDYFKNYEKLSGVHLKDISANDAYSLKTNSEEGPLKDFVTIVKDGLQVGLVDKVGGIYLSEELKIAQKLAPSGDGAVVFEIQDSSGKALFEAFLGAKFETITNVEWEKVKDLMALLKNKLWKLAFLRTAHAADLAEGAAGEDGVVNNKFTALDTDKDGLSDLEELIIGTKGNQADSNGDGINDLDSLNKGLNPLIKDKELFSDVQVGQEGFAEIIKLFRRGLIVADQNGKIRPKDSITREEFIKLDLGGICIICDRFAEKTKNSVWSLYSQSPFPDLDINDQYKYCVAEGKNRGIISGYKAFENAGYYIPKASISRAEATKVILETARQQIESFPEFINEEPANKPWYYNYVLTAQKEGLYPKGKFLEIDQYKQEEFKKYFNEEIAKVAGLPGGIANSQFLLWMNQPISRVEFAIMVSKFTDKYNCLNIDSDGDSIPDNLEKYIYGTNPFEVDTDKGGVHDDVEILRGSNPLDSKDDFPVVPEDLNADPDGDGLNTGKEKEIGSDPNDPDTDKGGVHDGTEVLRGTDPLDQGDDGNDAGQYNDLNGIDGQEGAYLAGIEIKNATIYTIPEDGSVDQSQINTEETDRIPADGESVLYIKASIYDENGKVRADDTTSIVNFGFLDNKDYQHASLNPLKVKVKNGVAETVLTAKTLAGLPTVIASIDGENVPSYEKLIEVHALEPAKAELRIVSPIIPSGGLSSSVIKGTLRDKFGNLANAGNYTASFRVNVKNESTKAALAKIDDKNDEDKNADGVQVSSVTGEFDSKLISGLNPEDLQINFSYQPTTTISENNSNDATADLLNLGASVFKPAEVSAAKSLATRDDLSLTVTADKTELKIGGKEKAKLTIKLEDKAGNVLNDFEGDVTLKILSDKIADLVEGDQKTKTISKKLEGGQAEFTLAGTLKAGEIVAIASVNGVKPTTLTMESYADKANEINLDVLDKEIAADPNQFYTINAKLFDFAGNQVDRDNSSMVEFSIDPETAKFATIVGEKTKKVVDGQTDVTIKTGTLTGPIRVRAKSADMTDGSIELYAKTEFKGRDFRDIKPKVLFASMLGSNFGQVTDEDYLAGWFVFSGKVQSAVSLIAEPKPKVHLAEVSSTGKVTTSENADMETVIKSTTTDELPIRQIVTDLQENKDVMEIIAVLKPQTIVKQIQNTDEIEKLSDVIYVMLSDAESEIYQINNDGEKAQLTKSGDLIVEIEKTGKIRLYSPTIELIETEDDFGSLINLTVLDQGNEIAQIIISPGDLGDVKIVDSNFKFSGELATGIYLRQLSAVADRKFVMAFSGNSSKQSKGAYYVDNTQELGGDQAPGLGYDSLEKGGDVDGIGFKGDNKHMLLMAAGNSVGEANLPFASDAGVVIGDPTIKLNNQKDPTTGDKLFGSTGFTKDIGKMLYAGVTNIKDISTVDFDNDSDKDILIAYQDGKVRLLENMNKGKGFVDRGNLIDLANGLLSLAVGDINNDGWEDLVIASADSCKVGEVCIDAFLNNQGNFVRKNLNLEGFNAKNKVYVVKIADMNQDSYPDLITSDDTGTIKVFYTKEGQLNRKPSVIGGLGSKVSQTDNLKEEVFVNYSGMTGNAPGNADDRFFQKILVKGEDASKDKNLEFKSLSNDAVIGVTSTKKVSDQTDPKNVLAEQDELLYTIKLTNSANVAVNNLLVADIVSSVTTLDPASIKCLDCQKDIALISTGISLRPYVIAGIDLPAKATRTITYSTKVGALPKVKIAVGQNLSSIYPVKDGYPDIMATPENNPTGRIVYYYSISKNSSNGEINYGEMVSPDPNAGDTGAYKQPVNPKTGKPVGIDLKLFDEKGPDGLPVAVKHFMDYGTFPGMEDAGGTNDEGLPGVGGALDGIGESLDAAADDLAAGIAALTCSGGCIPLPINYAFLAPGPINVMGIPSGFDPGLPVFAAGIPSIIPVWPPSPYQASVFRLYVMPTLTGKMATSMCMGTYLVGFGPVPGNCFTIVLPLDIYAGLCALISGAIEGAIGSANEFSSDGSGTIGMSDDGSLANTPTADGSNYTGGFSAATSLGNYGIKAGVSTNVRIPGFPSVITDWLDNQSSEIINKLTDLPDIYILLPDLLSPFKSGTKNSASQGADNLTLGDKNVKKEPVSPKGLRGVL
ncbi:VCBS repeat-containing protein, partial [Candidatus Peregrinibacteria bacterium]|nr:VCBS repeat-containing protein [Candidatus Peregrinibacteria bacterium]